MMHGKQGRETVLVAHPVFSKVKNKPVSWVAFRRFSALSDNALLHASLFEDSLLSLSHCSREEGERGNIVAFVDLHNRAIPLEQGEEDSSNPEEKERRRAKKTLRGYD